MQEITPGSLIEIQMGRKKGQTGIVIGAYRSEESGYALLAVWLEGRELDLWVLPETVEVLASRSDILPDAPVMLAPEELTALRQVHRTQEIRAAW